MPTFAMYEVVLSHMRKRFVHERERDLISIGGFNMLAAALVSPAPSLVVPVRVRCTVVAECRLSSMHAADADACC